MRVALYICPQTVLSSLSMALDALQLANQLAGQTLFEVQRISADGQAVELGIAELRVQGDMSLADSADLLLIPATGSALQQTLDNNTVLLDWLRERPSEQALASLCSSACLLAASGQLDERRATTHWRLANSFRQRFPNVRLQIDQLFTEDNNRFCSGGAQAGLDLCLHLIARYAGDWLAEQVAGTLVIERERGKQSRFTPLLPSQGLDDPQMAALLRWMRQHHAEAIDLPSLAERAHCSPRTLLRRFRTATGLTPNDYLQRLRISAAQQALRNPACSLEQVAEQVGYADRASFAKRFKQLCGETPGAFRKRLRQQS
ncbi:helix-turn-helix domain-containing protein [Pseudomonas sp. GOM6]|uniref:GlxA family transcriptional regulator n=1 Tax=Pseudomonas sp. GOM6 TaxID=3036944 RepID=UPI002409976A|nr:helix-turn-helix domain-containing protein [Pseudomonas sp. GOM6]MDG1580043.1 helix-turn-helix domain-containing protein [Pseudomonas sp. GOM6]